MNSIHEEHLEVVYQILRHLKHTMKRTCLRGVRREELRHLLILIGQDWLLIEGQHWDIIVLFYGKT